MRPKPRDDEATERLSIETAQRDPSRFGDLYEANVDRVYAFVVSRIRDRHEAEDVTSEVFHKALENLGRFEWRGVPFAAWLLRIAAHAIIDRAKRAARERDAADLEGPVEALLATVEPRVQLFQMVERLPADQRRVVVMRFGEEKSVREIAYELGRSEGAVKQLQFRGLQSLRTRLGERRG